jgi:hypothetical protein
MSQVNMDPAMFTEDDFLNAASFLRVFVIIMNIIRDGEIVATLMPNGELFWRKTAS